MEESPGYFQVLMVSVLNYAELFVFIVLSKVKKALYILNFDLALDLCIKKKKGERKTKEQ